MEKNVGRCTDGLGNRLAAETQGAHHRTRRSWEVLRPRGSWPPVKTIPGTKPYTTKPYERK